MRKLKKWLIERILPVWARAELMAENEQLRKENEKLRLQNVQLNAYIDGLEVAIKSQRKIVVYAGEVKK